MPRSCSGMPSWTFSPSISMTFVVVLGRGQARLDEAERDRVAVDLELAPLLGQRLGQADDAELARRVVRLAGVAVMPEVEETLTILRKTSLPSSFSFLAGSRRCGRGGADDPERRDEVDVEHPLEPVVAHLVDGRVERVAGVVDDDVELAPGVDRGLDELVRRVAPSSGRRRRRRSRPGSAPAASSAASLSRSLMTTFAPCSESSSAVARPMPRADPVTIATLSSRTPMCRVCSFVCLRRAEGAELYGLTPERVGQVAARRDPELRVRVAQVPLDRLARDEELLGDLAVAPALGRELGDAALARAERLAARGARPAARAGPAAASSSSARCSTAPAPPSRAISSASPSAAPASARRPARRSALP